MNLSASDKFPLQIMTIQVILPISNNPTTDNQIQDFLRHFFNSFAIKISLFSFLMSFSFSKFLSLILLFLYLFPAILMIFFVFQFLSVFFCFYSLFYFIFFHRNITNSRFKIFQYGQRKIYTVCSSMTVRISLMFAPLYCFFSAFK